MVSRKKTSKPTTTAKSAPAATVPAATVPAATVPAATVPAATAPATNTATVAVKKSASATPVKKEQTFDVTQAIYSQIKDVWAWGKTVPVVEHILGFNEWVVSKILESLLKTDLPALDKDVAKPNLKKVDDHVVTPAVRAAQSAWEFVAPAVHTADEFVVQPITGKVMDVMNKKNPDANPNPEYTTAPMK
ncbi:hypothetical protein ACHAXN_004223 [Cyclotella atomus]